MFVFTLKANVLLRVSMTPGTGIPDLSLLADFQISNNQHYFMF